MFKQRFYYWLPRIFIISFVCSLILPAPEFISKMTDNAFIIWLADIFWAFGLLLVFLLIVIIGRFLS